YEVGASLTIDRSVGAPGDAAPSLLLLSGPAEVDTTVTVGFADPGLAIASCVMAPVALCEKPTLPLPNVHAAPWPPDGSPSGKMSTGLVAAGFFRSTRARSPDPLVTPQK